MKFFKFNRSFVLRLAAALVLFLMSAVLLASDFTAVEYINNYDGDTLTVNLKDLPEVFGKEIPVRIRGIDSPEMNADRKCEKKAAVEARRFLRRMLVGRDIKLLGCERDKYFRLLCTVKAAEVDVAERILKGRWGLPYDGRTKARWVCGDPENQD